MSQADTAGTAIDHDFAGRARRFQLRIGEIGELERICKAGIGAIMVRLGTHQFYAADVWETVRLGLEGGGTPEASATALVRRYCHQEPIAGYIGLAAAILTAAVDGVKRAGEPGKGTAEGGDPETSPPSTPPEAPPA